ncbi:MAG: bifunctional GNAT family N-acetyltransferase/carbon-nitrogen hydrolase family protein [Pseudomonadota bacterium]
MDKRTDECTGGRTDKRAGEPATVEIEDRSLTPAALEIRNAELGDIGDIVALTGRAYPGQAPYTHGQVRGQINTFPEGQFVVTYDGEVVGYAATFCVKERLALADHTWEAITGNGHAARHDPGGDWLYGMEVCVDGTRRRLRIGKRLYEARKRLCQDMGLKGIVFGGRLPGYHRKRKQFAKPEDYLQAVIDKEVRDPVASFHLRSGFEPLRVLRGYHADDKESGGHAALMVWRNPYYDPDFDERTSYRRNPDTARITTVQMQARAVESREEFYRVLEHFIDAAADYQSDFVVFPELFTLQMLSAEKRKLPPEEAIERLSEYTEEFVEKLRNWAIGYNINIIGGSHPTRTEDGDIQNVAYVALRDGSMHAQEKLHPTPDERYWWNIKGGDEINAIQTDCGPIGVMICYDSEFPELARRLVDQGARILFVPFCTDTRHGHLRVKYCCQARAVENQAYVVTAGNTGNLPDVENMDIQYAQSAIYTPCDFPFARDGIAAETSENIEMVAVADLNLSTLSWARAQGSVRNLRDRRFDLYRVRWTEVE